MAEETPVTQPEPTAASRAHAEVEAEAQKPQRPRGLTPEVKARLNQRKPTRDPVPLVLAAVILFLGFMFSYYVYTYWTSSTPRVTKYIEPKPEMYPLTKLVSATQINLLDQEGGRAEIIYDFGQVAANRPQLERLLKNWRGPRNTLDRIRVTGRDHEPIKLEAGTGFPLTPLLSAISFDGDLEYTVEFEALRSAQLWFFFHYIYDYEVSGPALVVKPDGEAQFVRYRRELAFDDPQGTPGRLEVGEHVKQTVRIVVREFPYRAGFRCVAFQGEREVTRADFAPEWGEDRRYTRSEIGRRLVADFAQPPQAGYLAVVSDPPRAVRLHRIVAEGTVPEVWRAERTERVKMLEELLKPVAPGEQPAEPDDGSPSGDTPSGDTPSGDTPPPANPPKADPGAADR